MARPTEAKDIKPKADEPEAEQGEKKSFTMPAPNANLVNLITTAVLIVLCTTASSAASMYFLAPLVLKPLLSQTAAPAPKVEGEEGEAAEGEGEEEAAAEDEGGAEEGEEAHLPTVGPVVDLEEFTVNLKDTKTPRYLRADVSLTVTAEDPAFEKLEGEAMHKWEEGFHVQMGHYVPAIRDIVISSLTKRTAADLSSAQGKELFKEEVKKQVDGVFHGKRHVIRVNLENFIIQ